MTALAGGIIALALTGALWWYLRIRVRHLQSGAHFLGEFSEIIETVSALEMPSDDRQNLVFFGHLVGTGHIARRLFGMLVAGQLAAPVSREAIAARRKAWSGYHSTTRVLYVRTFYAGLLADSYFAGIVRGTLFRRAVFYLNADPAEIAKAVDTMETKILILGAGQVATEEVEREPEILDCGEDILVRA